MTNTACGKNNTTLSGFKFPRPLCSQIFYFIFTLTCGLVKKSFRKQIGLVKHFMQASILQLRRGICQIRLLDYLSLIACLTFK